MNNPQTEFARLLEQALIELSELRASIEYDEEFMEGIPAVIEPLERDIIAIVENLRRGKHQFDGRDLPFMELVSRVNKMYLPFKQLFTDLNELHKSLSADDADV